VLLPSLDRLVAWLSVYTREHSLEDLMAASDPDREEQARTRENHALLRGGVRGPHGSRVRDGASRRRLRFTGTSVTSSSIARGGAVRLRRHAAHLTDAALVLYHDRFTQVYEVDKEVA